MTTIISPHIDDAAFSLGLLIGKILKQNQELTIVNCFSISNFTLDKRSSDVERITALRKQEDEALNKLHNNQIKFEYLDLLDAPIRNRGVEFNGTLTDDDQVVITELRSYLVDNLRDSVQVYAPISIGNHVDHVICLESLLGLKLMQEYYVSFYEDLPYSQWVSEKMIQSKLQFIQDKTKTNLYPDLISFQDIELKCSLLNCYASQVNEAMVADMMRYTANLGGERTWHF